MPESQQIDINLLDTNDGQIPDVPPNPRYIKAERFEKLKKSISDYPELIQLRELIVYPLDGRYVTISGNMRLRAMRDLSYQQCPCKVLPAITPAKTLRAYVIKENLPYGENDRDALANTYDEKELFDFDMEKWDMGGFEIGDEDDGETDTAEKEPKVCPQCGYNFDENLTKQAYSLRARKHIKSACESCGSSESLVVHHINQNKADNAPENIQTLCKQCHDNHHSKARAKGLEIAGTAVIS